MSFIEFKDFNFAYKNPQGTEFPVLFDINLSVEEGDFVLFCGSSGSGKTTLFSNLKKELAPNGLRTGDVLFNGKNLFELSDLESATNIGFLFQNPDNQIVTDTVIQEIAFPLENIGLDSEEIRNRVAEMTAFFGIDHILHKNVNDLSGGQKQLVNLCSLLVLKPKLLILDEPTSQLDPIAAYDFLTILKRLNEEFSITILISEHKIDNVFPFADKVVFMRNGEIKYAENPYKLLDILDKNSMFHHYLPDVTKVYSLLNNTDLDLSNYDVPLTVREGKKVLRAIDNDLKSSNLSLKTFGDLNGLKSFNYTLDTSLNKYSQIFNFEENYEYGEELLNTKNLYFAYDKDNLILKDVNFSVKKGEFLSIIGGNGAGKSTFLKLLSGLLKPVKGKVNTKKDLKIAYLHQNPIVHFSKETVKEELYLNLDLNDSVKESILSYIKFFELEDLLNIHPYDCSGGEQQKIAIVKALISNPDILILDEPTKGLDPISAINLAKILKELQNRGITIIISSHNLPFVANYSERCIMIFDGSLQIDNAPKNIFSNNNFYTTFINRLVKDYIKEGVSLKDVWDKWFI
ncbi:MAG: ATP-binding cassette domain-containing protein [Methanobacteriaceae archaeon]|nr:ATP-binding cassette domain-containing protein [Methanobacteriaceae archaeon]